MTDLEITKLCAEAMELDVFESTVPEYKNTLWVKVNDFMNKTYPYAPLHDDIQAMALVKKFHLEINRETSVNPRWVVNFNSRDDDLNRAICECVAKMQAASTTHVSTGN